MEELKNTMKEAPTMYCYEQFADSLTEDQRAFLEKHLDDMLDYASRELETYEFLKTKTSLIDFMDYTFRAFEIGCLLTVEANEKYIKVYNGYAKILGEARREEWR